MMQPGMTTRNKRSAYFLAAGLVLVAAGAVLGSGPSSLVGLTVVALAVRYRKNPAAWEYLCFVALLTAMLVWGFSANSQPLWASSPLVGAIPLMLSYVFDYLDERRQKRAAAPEAALTVAASHGPRLAGAAPDGGPTRPAGNSGVTESPPSVT